MTSIKTATVNVRIQENVKVEAEAILKKLGLTRATAIDLFYRQIIMHNGIPFPLEIKKDDPKDKKRWRKIIQVEKLLNIISNNELNKFSGDSLKERVLNNIKYERIQKQVNNLSKKVKNEKQFNRQVELNIELKKLKNKLSKILK